MEGIEGCPDQQVQDEQRGELVEVANKAIGRQTPQTEQCKPAPQIPEQPGAQTVGFYGTRGQLRVLRSRWMSFSCSVARTSSASASA
jgi:hypothetical protein